LLGVTLPVRNRTALFCNIGGYLSNEKRVKYLPAHRNQKIRTPEFEGILPNKKSQRRVLFYSLASRHCVKTRTSGKQFYLLTTHSVVLRH
jgi:hypothetical protein